VLSECRVRQVIRMSGTIILSDFSAHECYQNVEQDKLSDCPVQ